MIVLDLGWISSILTSYYYNRKTSDVVKIIERTINRLKNQYPAYEDIDNDVDIFAGAIVSRYGDYGTSPRYGWLEPEYAELVISFLEGELKEYKEILSRSADEEAE